MKGAEGGGETSALREKTHWDYRNALPKMGLLAKFGTKIKNSEINFQ